MFKEIVMRPPEAGGPGFLMRELPELDYGLDAQVEITSEIDGQSVATGKILSAQVKAGPSYFAKDDDDTWSVYISARTVEYWNAHNVPVLLVIVDIDQRVAYWTRGDNQEEEADGQSVRIRVPKDQRVRPETAESWRDLAEHTTKEGSRLA